MAHPPDSRPPMPQGLGPVPPVDPLDFEATNPLPPVEERDRAAFEALAPVGEAVTPSNPPRTVPAIGALPSQAAPLAVEAPERILRKRRGMLIGFASTYGFAAVGAVVWGVSWPALLGCLIGGYVGMLAHEVVFHRLLSHRAFRVGRVTRFALTAGAMMWPARSPIWWAATHRHHHKHADEADDLHSPKAGRWHAFFGWLFEPRTLAFPYRDVGDLTRLPEMQALDRFHLLPFALSLVPATLAGWAFGEMWPSTGMSAMQGLIWWGLWRAMYPAVGMGLVNVVAHDPRRGARPYETADTSRNVRWLAWLTAGTGWHNNHHHYPHSARAGFRPGEFDPAYAFIEQLEKMGLASDLREVPEEALAGGAVEASV